MQNLELGRRYKLGLYHSIMSARSGSLSGTTLTSKPSTAFSASSSSASPPGPRLLFGEVNSSCNQSFKSARSTCGLILCPTPSLLEFWDMAACREALLHMLPRSDISVLRSVCHGISERVTAEAFSSINITFRTRTFIKSARLSALQRIGRHIREVTFRLPRSLEATLPPLIDPWTGEQKEFAWKPSCAQGHDTTSKNKESRYGDAETTELLIRQYPPLFHAATNFQSFAQAMSYLSNLEHLKISCPGTVRQDTQSRGTDITEIVVTSLRLAVEQAKLKHLNTLTLSHVCHAEVMALSPLAMGSHPGSARRWSNIRVLDISMYSPPSSQSNSDQIKLLREHIRGFKALRKFAFHWLGPRELSPLPEIPAEQKHTHPALRTASSSSPMFPNLEYLSINNATMSAPQVALLIQRHISTLIEVDLENVVLKNGTWQDALGALNDVAIKTNIPLVAEEGDVPIMLAPSMMKPLPLAPSPTMFQSKGQASKATDVARKMLLAEEIGQGVPGHRGHRSTREIEGNVGGDRKRRKTRDKTTWLQSQQLRRKCGDLFGWRMKNGPTLVVGRFS
ncbi:hypothetical protein D6D01_01756 [Aureobasidium pullulans]|uniref:Uncharacterized protein n=1 Tax=Aureobasidium pullulans TaxID=5580 RepID=A0A4S9LYE7_AURPU|nr:hypothetical protein D6D01_01756 [Aureobasidium pullulans]